MKKTTIKDLENKLYELEKNQYKLNDNIYKLESKLDDFKERIQSVEIRTGADLGIDVIINSQPDLLTQEEREYLKKIIGHIAYEIKYVVNIGEELLIFYNKKDNKVGIDKVWIKEGKDFAGMKLDTEYTIEELGL